MQLNSAMAAYEDAEIYFPNLDLDDSRSWKWLKDSNGPWNTFSTIMTVSLSFLRVTI
jgi:hypothetical protein